MISFLFLSLAQSQNTIEFCLYDTNKDLCNHVPEEYIIQDKEYEDYWKDLPQTKSSFNGYDSVTIYIAENLSKAQIFLVDMKDAHHIYLKGLNPNYRVRYILNFGETSTPEKVYISNSHCVKEDSTEFFMDELHLNNVSWEGYEKKNCFYGKISPSIISCPGRKIL